MELHVFIGQDCQLIRALLENKPADLGSRNDTLFNQFPLITTSFLYLSGV